MSLAFRWNDNAYVVKSNIVRKRKKQGKAVNIICTYSKGRSCNRMEALKKVRHCIMVSLYDLQARHYQPAFTFTGTRSFVA